MFYVHGGCQQLLPGFVVGLLAGGEKRAAVAPLGQRQT